MEPPIQHLAMDDVWRDAELNPRTGFQPLPRMHERFPDFGLRREHVQAPNQQTLGGAAPRQSSSQQPRSEHARVVDDEQVACAEQRWQFEETAIVERAGRPIDDQQTRKPPLVRRLLRNQLVR
jgi:hypothetical protein